MNAHAGTAPPSAVDLYTRAGLLRIDERFGAWLAARAPELAAALAAARTQRPDRSAESGLWLALAPCLDEFIAGLFGVTAELAALRARQEELAVLLKVRRNFVQRRVAKATAGDAPDGQDALARIERHLGAPYDDLRFAARVADWLGREAECTEQLAAATRFVVWATTSSDGQARFRDSPLLRLPAKRDPLGLVRVEQCTGDGTTWLEAPRACAHRQRDGFALTDDGGSLAAAVAQIDYCIYCHHQGKDTCSTGARSPDGTFRPNPLGMARTGCPLDERISEMHEARRQGHMLAALAIACVDNPMIAGTGHRICNDCTTGCIYQNQSRDAVDIPQAETRVLRDVLALPWGFEIYSLLTRWNPLNLAHWVPAAPTGRSILVVGTGPAGYTLAHHLLNDGHSVVAIDGLKIEPLPAQLVGDRSAPAFPDFALVRDFDSLATPLDERISGGFGGVAEYGITVRWDKNFLTVLRLLLERRETFALHGGTRFGGALTSASAFALGFDHVALCTGAGKPTVLGIPNGLAPGVRQASDFLMALQLTGAARADSLANLQIRLPVVVVGGGLTAVDTCTEALAYYPVQAEKFLDRHERLCERDGEDAVRRSWTDAEAQIAAEFLVHARALRAERQAAAREHRPADILGLLRGWGGARIAYRRKLVESPAYRNHVEIEKALEEGIRFGEQLTPLAVEVDAFGHAAGLRVRSADGVESLLPAKSILIAAGTVPNTMVGHEQPGFAFDGRHFQVYDESGNPLAPERCAKSPTPAFIVQRTGDGRAVTHFGDLHPSYAGNVVTAMASAKHGHPLVTRLVMQQPAHADAAALRRRIGDGLTATVVRTQRLAKTIVEIVVRAPLAAQAFRPGQFFRLQNFEATAPRVLGTRLAMEGLALTGAWVDVEHGHVGLIALEMGGSSSLCMDLRAGERVVLMGPTGEPTEVQGEETVLLAGGGLGNAVLFSIGRAMRAAGSRVLYFAAYRDGADLFRRDDIEAAADVVVWCSETAPGPGARRPQDRVFVGNIVAAMIAYATGRLGEAAIALGEVDRIIAIGSDRMMAAVAAARHHELAPHLKPGHVAIASINSPMQCMLKEICGQCVQTHRDPLTGEETMVFTCRNQDQPMDLVQFAVLRGRLAQNSVQEKLTARWLAACRTALPGP